MTDDKILEAATLSAPAHSGTSAYRSQWIKAFTRGASFTHEALQKENVRLKEAQEALK
jgi:hypothetical protein